MKTFSGFNNKGVLPKGIHEVDLEMLEKYFVDPFPENSSRRTIYNGFLNFLRDCKLYSLNMMLWINGSFVKDKINPTDIDFVMYMSDEDYNNLNGDAESILRKIIDERHKGYYIKYRVDAHFERVVSPGHLDYNSLSNDIKYWRNKYFENYIKEENRVDGEKGFLSYFVENTKRVRYLERINEQE